MKDSEMSVSGQREPGLKCKKKKDSIDLMCFPAKQYIPECQQNKSFNVILYCDLVLCCGPDTSLRQETRHIQGTIAQKDVLLQEKKTIYDSQ